MLTLLGLFLVIPSVVMAVITLVGCVLICARVFLEERMMKDNYGRFYTDYREEVGRWV